jgi:uncharacterized protein YeaO (DUF488 family)
MAIRIKRVYAPAEKSDGKRIMIDRLWPRGVKKTAVDLWLRDVAPSDALRNWFHHEEPRWPAFRARYRKELAANKAAVAELRKAVKVTATLLYGARDEKHNQAVVLAEYLKAGRAGSAKKSKRKAKTRKA